MKKDFKHRFIVSILLTIPVLVLSPLIQQFLGVTFEFFGSTYLLFGLSTIIYFYGGWPFLTGIYRELYEKSPGMMTLIAVAITVAYGYSSAVVFGLEGRFFFWELATLIDVMLLGHWIEMKATSSASKALEELAKLLPDTAHRLTDGETEDVKIDELNEGDKILIKPGEKIPADGVIVEGSSSINEAMLTGESTPVKKEQDDEVIGGSINGDGSLTVKITDLGEDSYLSQVITMVEKAQKSKSKTHRLADRAAFWLTVVALSVGMITFIIWYIIEGTFAFAVERMATVMVITCPHALGLAIPLVVAISTSLSAKNGLLIRNRSAFERARTISLVVFDKTGTLTKGEFGVQSVKVMQDKSNEEEMLRFAASVEQHSEHSIAQGILQEAKQREIDVEEVTDFEAIKGEGVQGTINGRGVKVVSPGYAQKQQYDIPEKLYDQKGTVVYVVVDEKIYGSIRLGDELRPESKEAVSRLQQQGIKVWMLTGDTEDAAQNVADELDLDGFFAGVLPDKKQEKIKKLQEDGEVVAMTGDGVNDAPALAQADIGIAIGSGTDVAVETADIVLVKSNPLDVTSLIAFGKATYLKMIQNLFWATGYNVIAIPLAAGVLSGFGIIISPAVGAALMSASTVIVAINARLLRVPDKDGKKKE